MNWEQIGYIFIGAFIGGAITLIATLFSNKYLIKWSDERDRYKVSRDLVKSHFTDITMVISVINIIKNYESDPLDIENNITFNKHIKLRFYEHYNSFTDHLLQLRIDISPKNTQEYKSYIEKSDEILDLLNRIKGFLDYYKDEDANTILALPVLPDGKEVIQELIDKYQQIDEIYNKFMT